MLTSNIFNDNVINWLMWSDLSGMTSCKSRLYAKRMHVEHPLIVIIRLMRSVYHCPKVIPLSSTANFITKKYDCICLDCKLEKETKNESNEILITNSALRKSWVKNLKQFLFLSVPSNFHSNNWGLILHNIEWKYKNVSCSVPRNRNAQTFQEWASQHKRISHCQILWKKLRRF